MMTINQRIVEAYTAYYSDSDNQVMPDLVMDTVLTVAFNRNRDGEPYLLVASKDGSITLYHSDNDNKPVIFTAGGFPGVRISDDESNWLRVTINQMETMIEDYQQYGT